MKCSSTNKTIFTKRAANEFINAHPDRFLRHYHCDYCNMYHLTHNELVNMGKLKEVENEAFKKFMVMDGDA